MLNDIFSLMCLAVILLSSHLAFGQDELRVLPDTIDSVPPKEMMKEYLLGRIDGEWNRWKTDYEARTAPEAIAEYQKRLHEGFLDAIGGLPERTPLNAQVVGVIERSPRGPM